MLDFLSMPRPPAREIARDLSAGGLRIAVRLTKLDGAEEIAVMDLAQTRIREYVGSAEDRPSKVFSMLGGPPPKLSPSLIYSATRIEAMMRGSERYPFDQLVAMTVTATPLWNALSALAGEVDADPKPGPDPEATGAAGTATSEAPPSAPV